MMFLKSKNSRYISDKKYIEKTSDEEGLKKMFPKLWKMYWEEPIEC